ncbi:MAG: radical SAM protein [Lewinellaceae bacterium]|nr:radical SAM protein [Lewinellaceae bacterium]
MKSNHTIGPVELLILQGSPFCNINCKYCYLPDRMNKRRMARETVEKTIDQLIADQLFGTDVSIVWHAGEPLAVPLAYYQELIPLIRERVPAAVRVRHHLQTNAMLINDEWCAFIKENQIQVGISVDGPQFLNDINRLTRSGKSTFGKVMQGIAYLNEHDINYHAIAVITRRPCIIRTRSILFSKIWVLLNWA